ncbi:hypothetical protein ACFLSA_01335 [Bacteroidota bacterium]
MLKLVSSVLVISSICSFVFAQFNDDFSDGNIDYNPNWLDDSSDYQINNYFQLQLIASRNTDISQIVTKSEVTINASWELYIEMHFKPSSQNYAEIFLVSNSADLNSDLSGYFLRIGYSNHDIQLFKQKGGNKSVLIDGDDEVLVQDTNRLSIRVERDIQGKWTLYSDLNGGKNFIEIGSTPDDKFFAGSYFGIKCIYTITRHNRFIFDNISVSGDQMIDNEKPRIDSISVQQGNVLYLKMNEPVNRDHSFNFSTFSLSANQLKILDILQLSNDEFEITFIDTFPLRQNFALKIKEIYDISGNKLSDTIINLIYFLPVRHDLIINEIMADPNPSNGLPEFEFIELFNRNNFPISLKDFTLMIGTSERALSSDTIQAHGFLILCSNDAVEEFMSFGKVEGLLGSNILTNSGKSLVLKFGDYVIDSVTYCNEWYKDDVKKQGGWSLERIDFDNTCSRNLNWEASIDLIGGTPGYINSVFRSNLDFSVPFVNYLWIYNNKKVALFFSEEIDVNSISHKSVQIEDFDYTEIRLTGKSNELKIDLKKGFSYDTPYTIIVREISDYCGNNLDLYADTLIYHKTKPNEIVISELMLDPSDPVNLPEHEYLELYNNSIYPVFLNDWKIQIGNIIHKIPLCQFEPKSYFIICDEDAVQKFEKYGKILGIKGLSALPNTGNMIQLLDENDNQQFFLEYSVDWIKEFYKRNGGWSLEMIDPANPCSGTNWKASIDNNGGTPGRQNSVFIENPDLNSPVLIKATLKGDSVLSLFFNERIDTTRFFDISQVIIYNLIESPDSFRIVLPKKNRIDLFYPSKTFRQSVIYTIHVKGIRDCVGNEIESYTQVAFGMTEAPEFNDIVINEILYDPRGFGSDFVELFNRSDRILDMCHFNLASWDEMVNQVSALVRISEEPRLLLPGEYIVITESKEDLKNNYDLRYPERVEVIHNMPSYPNKEGEVILLYGNNLQNVIDDMRYNYDMHYPLLAITEGVSLERINVEVPSFNRDNWHSASSSSGYATPGYENSQVSLTIEMKSGFHVTHEVFSPDNDGYKDTYEITYTMSESGYICDIMIFDSRGRKIKDLERNTLLGTSGTFYWDGKDNAGAIVKIGIYIVFIRIFHSNGEVVIYKKPAVLGGRLN